jgi:hypothetical protein
VQEEKIYEVTQAKTMIKDKHLRLIIDQNGDIQESNKKINRINRTNAKSDEVQGFRLFRRQRKSWGKDY